MRCGEGRVSDPVAVEAASAASAVHTNLALRAAGRGVRFKRINSYSSPAIGCSWLVEVVSKNAIQGDSR